jgi:hypothetical protein
VATYHCQALSHLTSTLPQAVAMSSKIPDNRLIYYNIGKGQTVYIKCINFEVEDQKFTLTEKEIQSEPESMFVEFLRMTGTMRLSADANLFRLIYNHLRGYDIFPLPPQGIPYMGKEATLKNLLRDATDFGLKNLVAKIEQERANQAKASSDTKPQQIDDDNEAAKEFVMLD